MSTANPKILITGATGQVGRKTIDCLRSQEGIEIVAAVRSKAKGAEFEEMGIGGMDDMLNNVFQRAFASRMLPPEAVDKLNLQHTKGMLLHGPPGTGKTLCARALSNECSKAGKHVSFFMRKGADCLSKWVGEAERMLRLLFDQAHKMRPSIIFFDEIDGLAPVRSSRTSQESVNVRGSRLRCWWLRTSGYKLTQ